eukprot:TRINITY_DN9831_c0_g1_i1.p1 TRINITY_DN9831_c0_g1~~TRINITY_DN9831_c0_g1_i1.p1  ORF type:complete len:407 (-),score=41.07 TRINITY_DN9831_c0_g1_i1:21-1241(-)
MGTSNFGLINRATFLGLPPPIHRVILAEMNLDTLLNARRTNKRLYVVIMTELLYLNVVVKRMENLTLTVGEQVSTVIGSLYCLTALERLVIEDFEHIDEHSVIAISSAYNLRSLSIHANFIPPQIIHFLQTFTKLSHLEIEQEEVELRTSALTRLPSQLKSLSLQYFIADSVDLNQCLRLVNIQRLAITDGTLEDTTWTHSLSRLTHLSLCRVDFKTDNHQLSKYITNVDWTDVDLGQTVPTGPNVESLKIRYTKQFADEEDIVCNMENIHLCTSLRYLNFSQEGPFEWTLRFLNRVKELNLIDMVIFSPLPPTFLSSQSDFAFPATLEVLRMKIEAPLGVAHKVLAAFIPPSLKILELELSDQEPKQRTVERLKLKYPLLGQVDFKLSYVLDSRGKDISFAFKRW